MVFDEEDALLRTAGDRSLLGQVIRFTVEDFPELMEGIKEAAGSRRNTETAKLAHKVKGSAGACGARKLYMAALDLEIAGRNGDGDVGELVVPVEKAFEEFVSLPRVRELASLDDEAAASIG